MYWRCPGGVGTGANFPHYPDTVDQVIAVEPEPRLRAYAEASARRADLPVEGRAGRAEALPADDASVDGAVVSLVLCTISDVPAALARWRVSRAPAAFSSSTNHVRSDNARFPRRRRRIDVIWPHLGGGCHLARDTEQAIIDAGS